MARSGVAKRANGQLFAALGDRLLSPLYLHKSGLNLACSAVLLPAFHFISWDENYRHSTAPSPAASCCILLYPAPSTTHWGAV